MHETTLVECNFGSV